MFTKIDPYSSANHLQSIFDNVCNIEFKKGVSSAGILFLHDGHQDCFILSP